MNAKRIGGQVNNIFASSTADMTKTNQISSVNKEQSSSNQKRDLHNSMVKSTVTFLNSHIVWLDRLSSDIRANTMTIIDRGAIIRGIITALEKSQIDLRFITSEEELSSLILDKLKDSNR